ncbi:alternative ribosome rescue aminoacyl-tRNA hydrolase ArfB [Gillisia limnaea]|uniref:Class I peptide chain release factor n=1 Tax=Gillisia limnaea (strain DSM 15749 / LMG 21470 / R-8282) TaxID=865937 RepID=H2BRY0_GILLR|nr:alternative ribosome rescue aminoacyl-tRNA hydrolase ArfB [Gillisia limnaea]EHQ02467.1 Class I peptide chain release factor [Gillisia limnaea DSM 15749]
MADYEALKVELTFKAVKSSGPGGQHVNKTASKIILNFDVENSQALSEKEKSGILMKLASRITNSGEIILESGETRSQHTNKELVTNRFLELVKKALKKEKPRKKTRPTKASKLKRLRSKKLKSEKKINRQKPPL